jgi:anti-sigma-K factor RskA
MTPEEIRERAALAGLGVLDGEERELFEAILRENPDARREMESFAKAAERLGLAAPRPHVLAKSSRSMTALAAAAAVLFALGFFVMRAERDEARRAAEAAREQAARAVEQARQVQGELQAARESLAREGGLRTLVSYPEARLVDLGPLPAAPRARARVVFNSKTRDAILIASGLEPAPEGKGYEVWVIGKAAPVPAGVFQVDAKGNAVHRLPKVAEVEGVKTFAVTLEPAGGVPAPTGPMVLAGTVS